MVADWEELHTDTMRHVEGAYAEMCPVKFSARTGVHNKLGIHNRIIKKSYENKETKSNLIFSLLSLSLSGYLHFYGLILFVTP